jgi:very-short-patch-repair endonuclease
MSLPEARLWHALRKRPAGLKFRRQQAAGPYVVDFFCHGSALVLEIDGESHNRGDQPERDAERDEYLRRNGYKVLRIPAIDALSDLDAVVRHIVAEAGIGSPLHHAPYGPPPLKGRI